VIVAGAVVVVLAAAGMVPATAQSKSTPSNATEVGVTPKAIRIAVMADVDNPFAPGLFQGAVDGAKGAAAFINSKAGGRGIGGRKLVVDFIDSHIDANATRNGIITACQNDFALVGTASLLMTNVDDEVNCKDRSGQPVGLPDIGALVAGVPESCSPVSYPVFGVQLVCSTRDQHPQTYQGNQGEFKYLLGKHGGKLHGAFIAASDTQDATRGAELIADTAIRAGIAADQRVTRSGRDPQSAYTPIVNKMKEDHSNYSYIAMTDNNAILLRSEAQLQGLTDPNMVWECFSCYTNATKKNASVMDGEYTALSYLPFEDGNVNRTLANFMKYVGPAKADEFAVLGWSAVLAFAQAARAVVRQHGVNGLTRSAFLTGGIPALKGFDAGGMIGKGDIPAKRLTSCFVLVQLRDGRFHRVHPTKKGTMDCKASNHVQFQEDLIGG
jgi:hypothetical protein